MTLYIGNKPGMSKCLHLYEGNNPTTEVSASTYFHTDTPYIRAVARYAFVKDGGVTMVSGTSVYMQKYKLQTNYYDHIAIPQDMLESESVMVVVVGKYTEGIDTLVYTFPTTYFEFSTMLLPSSIRSFGNILSNTHVAAITSNSTLNVYLNNSTPVDFFRIEVNFLASGARSDVASVKISDEGIYINNSNLLKGPAGNLNQSRFIHWHVNGASTLAFKYDPPVDEYRDALFERLVIPIGCAIDSNNFAHPAACYWLKSNPRDIRILAPNTGNSSATYIVTEILNEDGWNRYDVDYIYSYNNFNDAAGSRSTLTAVKGLLLDKNSIGLYLATNKTAKTTFIGPGNNLKHITYHAKNVVISPYQSTGVGNNSCRLVNTLSIPVNSGSIVLISCKARGYNKGNAFAIIDCSNPGVQFLNGFLDYIKVSLDVVSGVLNVYACSPNDNMNFTTVPEYSGDIIVLN